MAWCFSTRASVATVLTTHPCVSRCLRVNFNPRMGKYNYIHSNVWDEIMYPFPNFNEVTVESLGMDK